MLLGLNLSTTDRYLPAIMAVIYAGIAPLKALEELEKADARAKAAKANQACPG